MLQMGPMIGSRIEASIPTICFSRLRVCVTRNVDDASVNTTTSASSSMTHHQQQQEMLSDQY